MRTYSFFLAGVGGQGTLLASDILAKVGVCARYDVKKSTVHGMAQRGGAVSSHVRWGTAVRSPLIARGSADVLVAFERVEALRHIGMLRPGGKIIVNDHAIVPVTVTAGSGTYPERERIVDVLGQVTRDVTFVPAIQIAQELGNVRVNNVVILGVLSCSLKVPIGIWEEVIAQRVPRRYVDLNLEAFSRGRALQPMDESRAGLS